jgi:hypothetical protein
MKPSTTEQEQDNDSINCDSDTYTRNNMHSGGGSDSYSDADNHGGSVSVAGDDQRGMGEAVSGHGSGERQLQQSQQLQQLHVSPASTAVVEAQDITNQVKLSKSEWDYTEIPEPQSEQDIMRMIISGFNNVNIFKTAQQSLISFLKIQPSDEMHFHLYSTFYKAEIATLLRRHKKNECDYLAKLASDQSPSSLPSESEPQKDLFSSWKGIRGQAKEIKKIDRMRIDNIKTDPSQMTGIYENVLLGVLDKMLEHKYNRVAALRPKWMYYYYSLSVLFNNRIEHLNANVNSFVAHAIEYYELEASATENVLMFIQNAYEYVERNEFVHRYANLQLYEHQKQLFTVIKRPGPKLVLYIAPTGTGKTLSPLGLTEQFRVVFICAARHVGIALAKSAITMKKKVAFAFGCNNIDDIRLHYFAAKEATRDWRTGGIRKVDNSVGDNVELMICDIKSYLYAMHYMHAFNPLDKLVMYWDEPTIMLDYADHVFHPIIHNTWAKNIIPNVVLSSATLPNEHEIKCTLSDFHAKFVGGETHSIVSHDCKKSIPIVNKDGFVELPHFIFAKEEYATVQESVAHCEQYKTIMRYLDLREVVRFICAAHKMGAVASSKYSISRYFSGKLSDITMTSIKVYYLKVLGNVKPDVWPQLSAAMTNDRAPLYKSSIYFSTRDAHTLTDGPTIYLTGEVDKIANFALQSANIPSTVFDDIMEDIEFNAILTERIDELEKRLDDERAKREGSGGGGGGAGAGNDAGGGIRGGRTVSKKEQDSKLCINDKSEKVMKRFDELFQIQGKVSELRAQVKTVTLNELFVPNSDEHFHHWVPESRMSDDKPTNKFSGDVDPETVERIMLLPVENSWKLLLLMGIGVISNSVGSGSGSGNNTQYNDIIKSLAQNQKLYFIIASSDYIYGTNYQFCHGYIGKDLSTMTQEKTIQAMGRIGRNALQQDYTVRFREDGNIRKLFLTVPPNEKIEVVNMNRLFHSRDM